MLELSSFQLHTTFSLQADAATVLNITQDHLDWHGDMDAYAADKARIFGAHTVRVLNRDDARVMRMAAPAAHAASASAPTSRTRPNSFGLVNENGMLWLAIAVRGAKKATKQRRKKDEAREAGR